MSRQPYYEVVRRNDGWLARLRGSNGHKVFTSELYTRRSAAYRAVEIARESFYDAGDTTREVVEADERTGR